MSLFGGGKQTRRMRLVPRAPGDTTPLDPAVAEAIRRSGMDPTKFTIAPYEHGEAEPPVEGLFKSGSRVEHTFLFEGEEGIPEKARDVVADGAVHRVLEVEDAGIGLAHH